MILRPRMGGKRPEMDRVAKGNMHGAEGVRRKQRSTEPGEAGKGSLRALRRPPPSSDLQQVALLRDCLQGLFLGVPVRQKVWASDWPLLRQRCGPPPSSLGPLAGGPGPGSPWVR